MLLDPSSWPAPFGVLVGAAVAVVGGAAVAWLVVAVFGRWAKSTLTPIDDIVVANLASPVRWLLPLTALFLALPGLDLTERAGANARHVVAVAITLVISWVFFRVVRAFEQVVAQRASASGTLAARSQYTQVRSLSNVVRFLIGLTTAGLVLLSFAGIRELGLSMLASAGVAGIVIGFAAQRTLSAVVSGLVIAVAQPIRMDDAVVVEGELGFVEEISLTYVVVRLLDGRCFVLPIGYFLERPFQNWSRSSTQVRSGVEIHVDYSAPIDSIREELRKIIEGSPHWDHDYWELFVADTKERGMVLKASASAADPRKASALRAEVREKLVVVIQSRWPNAFPRVRADLASVLEKRVTSSATPDRHS